MLFVQSLTYNIADPDDGTCEDCETQLCCEEPKSFFNSNSQMCYWKVDSDNPDPDPLPLPSSSLDGTCHFIPIDGDMTRMFVVAIISAVVSAPVTLSIQFLITHVLSRDVRTDEDRSRRRSLMTRVSTRKTRLVSDSNVLDEVTGRNLQDDLKNLLQELRQHYQSLQGKEKQEFAGKISLFLPSFLPSLLRVMTLDVRYLGP